MAPAYSHVCYLRPTFNGGFNGALAVSENSLDQERETAEDQDVCGERTGVLLRRASKQHVPLLVQLRRLHVVLEQ